MPELNLSEDDQASYRWFVLAVEPQQEGYVQSRADQLGMEVYYPLARKLVRILHGRRAGYAERILPAMSGYVFVRLAPGARFDLFRRDFDSPEAVPHCLRWLSGEFGPEPLPDGVIEDIQRREETGQFDEAARVGRYVLPRWVVPGAKVRLIRGPFAGFSGAVLRTVNRQMIRVSVQIMGRASDMEMPLDYLSRLK